MNLMPCEFIVWHGLPVIRKKIVESMINKYGLKQKEVAKKLCISPATVSQYLSGKRGKSNINDKNVCKEINISAKRIIQQGDEILVFETCRLCNIFKSKNLFNKMMKEDTRGIL